VAGPTGPIAPRSLVAVWAGTLPAVVGPGLVYRVPYLGDGTATTFQLRRAYARMETPLAALSTFQLQSSPGGDGAFTATTFTALTVVAGDREQENILTPVTVHSGDLLRIVYAALGGSTTFHVELTGGE
jgi:hypothetical protein